MDEIEHIQNLIYIIRGQRVMLDFDLSAMYGVETKALNQAVKRNIERFPEDFMFQLTKGEFEILRSQIVISRCADIEGNGNLRSQIVTSKDFSKMRSLPNAFTEQGVAMLSSVLRSPLAIQVNIGIIRAFVDIRRMVVSLPQPDVNADAVQLRKDFDELKRDIEDILANQNEINEDTRVQLDVINEALAQLQSDNRQPRRPILGFSKPNDDK